MQNLSLQNATVKLKELAASIEKDVGLKSIINARDDVLSTYSTIFSLANVKQISEDEFKSFLLFKNNRHWGLHRKGPLMCSDINKLRESLAILLDEARPIGERLEQAIGNVAGMGKGVATAILLVAFPDKYGVWNNTSEAALRKLVAWPSFDYGDTLGKKYDKINQIIQNISAKVGVDIWTLDSLFWRVLTPLDPAAFPADVLDNNEDISLDYDIKFGLERHLHEFLRDNWAGIDLGREWLIYEKDGEEVGFQYPCDVGIIDLLVKHKTQKKWLVIELKRDYSSDKTVGQILRYMGWIKEHLASQEEDVSGLVIAHKGDNKIRYALKMVPSIQLKLYEVEFRLREP